MQRVASGGGGSRITPASGDDGVGLETSELDVPAFLRRQN
jgi:hypothetical protein